MKVVTWNVNSVRSRYQRLISFLQKYDPDVVCLQELKCTEEQFPLDDLKAIGYCGAAFGQKAYNGVAILAKQPLTTVQRGFLKHTDQARFISATINEHSFLCVYVPNGQEVGHDRYHLKLQWLGDLGEYLRTTYGKMERLVVLGDFNIAPEPTDVYDPVAWSGKILFSDAERAALKNLLACGLVDLFRLHHGEGGHFSWWDYRGLAFPFNHGLRIDLILASQDVAERCSACTIIRDERKGEKPSDHVPVVAELKI